MSATTYPRPVFASIDEVRVGMVVLTHNGRRLRVTKIDKRRQVVHYAPVVGNVEHYAGFSTFASIVESVVE